MAPPTQEVPPLEPPDPSPAPLPTRIRRLLSLSRFKGFRLSDPNPPTHRLSLSGLSKLFIPILPFAGTSNTSFSSLYTIPETNPTPPINPVYDVQSPEHVGVYWTVFCRACKRERCPTCERKMFVYERRKRDCLTNVNRTVPICTPCEHGCPGARLTMRINGENGEWEESDGESLIRRYDVNDVQAVDESDSGDSNMELNIGCDN